MAYSNDYIKENPEAWSKLVNSSAGQICQTAIPIGPTSNVKVAALFFKYLVPMTFAPISTKKLYPPFMLDEWSSYTHSIVMSGLIGSMYHAGYDKLIEERTYNFVDPTGHFSSNSGYEVIPGCEDAVGIALLEMLDANTEIYIPEMTVDGARLDMSRKVPIRRVVFEHNFSSARAPIFGCDLLGGTDKEVNSVLVTLTDIPWIDLTRTPWEQVFEFRRDEDSLKKFRNFRLFLSTTYAKKDPQFIQDDFLKRLDDFDATRKKHGFDMQNSAMKTVIKSKYILGGGLSGLFAWLFGSGNASEVIGSAALLAGVSVEMAGIFLDIRAANFTLRNDIDGHDLAYAIKARTQLAVD